jgi:hypothetical protein
MQKTIVAGLILLVATAVATNMVQVPYVAVSSPIATVIMVIAAIGAFSVYPAIGVALFVLTAVLFFKRNVNRASLFAQSTYGEDSIMTQPHVDAHPYESQESQPRDYSQFKETDASNPALGPVVENFEPAPYGDEQGAPVDGQYPKERPRASEMSEERDYTYRPDADTGSNDFQRYGPDLDEKISALSY